MASKRKFYINGKLFTASVEGMPRVGRELIREFDFLLDGSEFEGMEITVVIPSQTTEEIKFRNLKVARVGYCQGVTVGATGVADLCQARVFTQFHRNGSDI